LARLNLVSQIKSDILGRDVLVLSEFETTSSGAAMMVLIGQGIYSNQKEAAVKFANIRMIIKPDMENHKKYQYMYGLYKDTYQSLKGLFVRRTHILEEIRSGREVKIENL
jgi:xylulokinase